MANDRPDNRITKGDAYRLALYAVSYYQAVGMPEGPARDNAIIEWGTKLHRQQALTTVQVLPQEQIQQSITFARQRIEYREWKAHRDEPNDRNGKKP